MPRIAVLSTAHIHSRSFCQHLVDHTSGGGAHVIWDDQAERGRAYAEEFQSRYEADLDAVLADAAVEGFVITAENTRHLPLLRQVLPLGKPVLCEKPLCTTLTEAEEIAALVARHGTPLTSGYFMPFNARLQGARQLIESGGLGRITHISHRNAHSAAYGRWFDKPELAWFADPELAGGGALLDLGTHSVHLVRTLFGPVEEVWATVTNLSGNYSAVDDYGSIMLRFASGVLGRVEAGWCQQGGRGGLEVFGSELSLWQQAGGFVTGKADDPTPVAEANAEPDRIDRLIALITGELGPASWQTDLACCLDAVAIMTATYASAASGRWERVASITPPTP